ncbi:hypothetical protein Lal_00001569, partial [Lupinus albus]
HRAGRHHPGAGAVPPGTADHRAHLRDLHHVPGRRADLLGARHRAVALPGPARSAGGAQGHRPDYRAGRSGRHHRPQRLGQDHPAALPQPAGRARRRHPPGGADRDRRQPAAEAAAMADPPAAPARRLRVPELQPLPPPHRAGERHRRPGGGEEGTPRARHRPCSQAAGQGRPGGQGRRLPQAPFRRPATARGHRPCPGDGTGRDPLRRAHLRPRPRAGRRGADHHPRPGRGEAHHGHRHPRDELRPRCGQPRDLHRQGRDRRTGRRQDPVQRPEGRTHPAVPRQVPGGMSGRPDETPWERLQSRWRRRVDGALSIHQRR